MYEVIGILVCMLAVGWLLTYLPTLVGVIISNTKKDDGKAMYIGMYVSYTVFKVLMASMAAFGAYSIIAAFV